MGESRRMTIKSANVGKNVSIDPTPQRAVTEYFEIKNEIPIVKKKPEKDSARTTPISGLIAARRQLDVAMSALQAKRSDMTKWGGETDDKWEDLKTKQLKLRDSVIRFHHFVKENHEKRQRALEKINKEQEIQKRREREIADLQAETKHFKAVESQIDKLASDYQIYRKFLEEVVEKTPEAKDILELLNRYETLASTRSGLSGQQAEALASIQTARTQLTHTAGEQAQVIVGLQTTLADLRVKLEEAHLQAAKWNSILSRIRDFAAGKAIEIEQVRSSCLDLYKTICKLRKEPMTLAESDTEEQLTLIAREIETLSKAVTLVTNKIAKSVPTTNVNAMASNQPLKTISSLK